MQKEVALACIVGPFYLVYGLSILIYPRQWKKVVAWLERDHFAFLPLAMMGLVSGLVLVNAYNIWDWNIFTIITVTGWAILFKAVFYFLAPGKWITSILRWRALAHVSYFYFAGAVMTLMGAALVHSAYWGR